jgi:DNA-binding transcriptional ArsR family regulator
MNEQTMSSKEKENYAAHIPTNEQEKVLSNPKVLDTFIHLIDQPATIEELSRRTKYNQLQLSVLLDQLEEVNLVASKVIRTNGKSLQIVYQVIDPQLDLSNLTNILSPTTTLDLLYNKIKSDLTKNNTQDDFLDDTRIKYSQVKVKAKSFEKLLIMMDEIESFLKENETNESEEGITVLQIAYRKE